MKKMITSLLAFGMSVGICAASAQAYTFNPEKPYDGVMTGLFNNIPIQTEADEGESTIYLTEGLQPWAPAVILLTPDNTTAEAFAESEVGLAWRAVADENKIGLALLGPEDGKTWNLTMDEQGRDDADVLSQLYMTMRSKSVEQVAPFSMDKTHVTLVGYGEGGAAALLFGAQTATEFSAICAVDATSVSGEAMTAAGEKLVLPFPADSERGVEEMHVLAKTVDTPVWFIRSAQTNPEALAFYIAASDAKETEANEFASSAYVAENPAVRIWVSEEEKTPKTIYSEFLSKTNRFMAMQDGGRVAFTTDFTQTGFTRHEEVINGELRRWVTYVPSTYDATKETPLVMAIHGYTATAESTAEESRWNDIAEENGFIMIYPQGMVRPAEALGNIPCTCWVAGGFAKLFADVDPMVDVNFINALLDRAESEFNIDKTRIYATGHSNGSMMTWELGIKDTGRFAAIAPIGAMSAPAEAFSEGTLLPTWSFMGEYDGAGCTLIADNGNVSTLTAWNEHNGTNESNVTASEEYDGQWQTITFTNDENVPLVRFTEILRTAHIYMPEESRAIWDDFFSKYSRGEDGTLYYEGNAVAAGEFTASDAWYSPTDEEVKEMVAKELSLSREVAFYPAAYEGDFDQFYVTFHKLSRAQYEKVDGAAEPGINASHYDLCKELTAKREALKQIADPASTVWEIWGENMACENPAPAEGWDISYDNPGFRPFLNPYLIENQAEVKGNVVIIAGGGSTHRNNIVEGYPVAEFFNEKGYNAYVLQRRVNPYAAEDQWLDLGRAIRYIRHNAEEKGIGNADTIITCGFSAGGMNIMTAIDKQYGHVTPDTVYPDYVCDEVDAESADMTIAIPVYGLFTKEMTFTDNKNLPAVFAVAGHKDPLTAMMYSSVEICANIFPDFSFYLAPDAVHGVGLGTGTPNYVNAYTQIAQWPEMAINFIESRLGITPKTYELDAVEFSW